MPEVLLQPISESEMKITFTRKNLTDQEIDHPWFKNFTETEAVLVPGVNRFTCFLIIFVLGGIAAFLAKTIAAPIERIKLIQQCLYTDSTDDDDPEEIEDKSLVKEKTEKLEFGIINCAGYIYRNEGNDFWKKNLW